MEIKYVFQKVMQKIFNKPIIKSSKISRKAAVWNDSLIINSSIDAYSYVSDHTSIYYTCIGKFCSIAQYCTVGGAEHPINYVSTSPIFLQGRNPFRKNLAHLPFRPYKKTVIGNDVWIGARSCIKSGVKIGDGAIIGMGSVVVKDVGPYEIWAGNPAKLIRKRFDNETVESILKTRWWDKPDSYLKKMGVFMDKPNEYLNQVVGEDISNDEV